MKAIVWTQGSCPFCEMAKDLLAERGIEYEERKLDGKNWTVKQLREVAPYAVTVPQIFLDDEHVGGFDHLEERLAK